jgi:two-component system alkaline phosphatase synthesis response regulator PhoP
MVVLAIADERARRQYTPFLTEHGFTVLAAENGSEAVEIARRFLPEIVVVDLARDGARTAESLRAQALTESVGIVVLAPNATKPPLGLELDGRDALLETPCAPEALLTELLVMLARLMPDSDVGGGSPANKKSAGGW